ncbi:hypothetical protein AMTRI_Chr09g21340 [Amborella trichopoda]
MQNWVPPKLISLWDERAYTPCAFPITLDVSSGPSVMGSSTMTTVPKRVGEAFVVLASATTTAIGFSAKRRSCKWNSMRLTFGSPRPSFAWQMPWRRRKAPRKEAMPVANAVFPLILDLGKIE